MAGENHAQLHVNGDQILPALLADIERAQVALHVSFFLIFRDPIGVEIVDRLAVKARNGVKVRVLLNIEKTALGDPFSTGEKEMMKKVPGWPFDPMNAKPLCEQLRAAGAEVVDTDIDYDATPKNLDPRLVSIASQIREGIDVDMLHIDHRKMLIVDGRIAWCGGANLGAQYIFHHPFDPAQDAYDEAKALVEGGKPEPWWKWHDSLTRFEGPIAQQLDDAFRDRWLLDGGEPFSAQAPVAASEPPQGRRVHQVELLTNEPSKTPNAVREGYLRLIAQAEREIFIENPYLYQPALVKALCEAKHARPKLDIVLVVPQRKHNDNLFSQDAQEFQYATYLKCGIAVHEYQNHFTHLKIAVFDARWSIHGSTNLNCRSLEDDKDFEAVVLVDDEAFARETLEKTREVDLKYSKRIVPEDLRGSFMGWRRRHRDPRTLFLLSRRML